MSFKLSSGLGHSAVLRTLPLNTVLGRIYAETRTETMKFFFHSLWGAPLKVDTKLRNKKKRGCNIGYEKEENLHERL